MKYEKETSAISPKLVEPDQSLSDDDFSICRRVFFGDQALVEAEVSAYQQLLLPEDGECDPFEDETPPLFSQSNWPV